MDNNRTYIALAVIFVVIALTLLRSSNVGLVDFYDDGTQVAQRSGLNLISGDGITVTGADDSTNSRVNVTIETSAASGTGTVSSSSTTVNVTHALGVTPSRVLITPGTDWTGTVWWVSAKTSTTFTVTINPAIGSDFTFDWRASKEE